MLFDLYRSKDISVFIAALLVCQNAYETKLNGGAVFATPNFLNNNNIGGITWNNNTMREGAVKNGVVINRGTPRGNNEGSYYVRFQSVRDCAMYIASMYKINYENALRASTLDSFVSLIKRGGYFDDPEDRYIANLKGVKNNYLDPNLREIIDNPQRYNEELDPVAVKATIKKKLQGLVLELSSLLSQL
ncbi:MAG: hypothetical protein JST62_01070 [Bacteroidetes bacterium]|nr:hypothetical protein [Bacteroidota bacterium]